MKILITNDDGINAKGINELYNSLSTKHEVYLIAPDQERSACSNAFNMRTGINVKEYSSTRFSASSYPADCVSIGLHNDIVPDVDLIISGINHGPNLGDDLFFSGTVGGARTAYIFGKSAIAVSYDCFMDFEYMKDAADFVLEFIESRKDELVNSKSLYNINYPKKSRSEVKGIKYTRTSERKYTDSYDRKEIGENEFELKLVGSIDTVVEDGTDFDALQKGYISITPLTIESTDLNLLEKLRKENG